MFSTARGVLGLLRKLVITHFVLNNVFRGFLPLFHTLTETLHSCLSRVFFFVTLSVSDFSFSLFLSFASTRLMLVSVFYLLLTLSLYSLCHFFSFFFVFWLGLLSGALWGNACSFCQSVCLFMCISARLNHFFSTLARGIFSKVLFFVFSQLNVLHKCHILLLSIFIIATTVTIKDIAFPLFVLCNYVVLHLYSGYIRAITRFPFIGHILCVLEATMYTVHSGPVLRLNKTLLQKHIRRLSCNRVIQVIMNTKKLNDAAYNNDANK